MRRYLLIALAAATGAPTLAAAQLIDQQRTDRRPPQAERPSGSLARPQPASPDLKTGPEAAATPLRQVRLEGSSLPSAAFEAAMQRFIGRPLSRQTVSEAAAAAAAVYAKSDIALYSIVAPNQDLTGGELRLVAVEGYIDQVALQGDVKGRDLGLVKAYADKLTRSKPLRRSQLERYLSLVRDTPGLTVDAQLLQGRVPGAVVMTMTLHQRRAAVDISVNNRGSAILGRTQLQADLNLYSLLREGDQTTLTLAAPTDWERFQYYALAHSQPIGSEGLRAQVSAGYYRTRPENPPSQGEATFGSLQLSYPLIRSYEENLYLTGALDGLNASNAVFGQGTATERTRALRAAAAWSKAKTRYVVSASAVGSLGLDALGARATPGLARPDFRKLNLRAGFDRALGEAWVVRLRASGQLSGDLLPASEQMTLGGPEFGRAFEQAAVIGDHGYAGSAELGWRPPNLPATFKGSELYGFVDGGTLTQRGRLGFPSQRYDLSSAGLGVRLAVNTRTVIGLEGARALTTPTPAFDKAWRVGISLSIVK